MRKNDEGHGEVESTIPGRLDRLPWTRWHVLVVVALGITWVLDGLEVTRPTLEEVYLELTQEPSE